MTVTRSGSLAAVDKLLALGANANAAESWHQQTALMWAAADDQLEIATALLRAGADVNARSKVWPGQPPRPRGSETSFQSAHSNFPKGGFTALHFAAQYGAGRVAGLLADAGANLQATEPDGITPLMMAIINGHHDVAAVLVRKGADVNAVDRSGRGALYHAVDMNTLEWLFSRPNPEAVGRTRSGRHRPAAARARRQPERAADGSRIRDPARLGRQRQSDGRIDAVHEGGHDLRRAHDPAAARARRRSHPHHAEPDDADDGRRRPQLGGDLEPRHRGGDHRGDAVDDRPRRRRERGQRSGRNAAARRGAAGRGQGGAVPGRSRRRARGEEPSAGGRRSTRRSDRPTKATPPASAGPSARPPARC